MSFKFGSSVVVTQKGFYEGAQGVVVDTVSSTNHSNQYYVVRLNLGFGIPSGREIRLAETEIAHQPIYIKAAHE